MTATVRPHDHAVLTSARPTNTPLLYLPVAAGTAAGTTVAVVVGTVAVAATGTAAGTAAGIAVAGAAGTAAAGTVAAGGVPAAGTPAVAGSAVGAVDAALPVGKYGRGWGVMGLCSSPRSVGSCTRCVVGSGGLRIPRLRGIGLRGVLSGRAYCNEGGSRRRGCPVQHPAVDVG